MLNKYCFILLLLFTHLALAQQRQVSFGEIDYRVRSIEPAPPAQLAHELTKDYTTDKEKLRAIFSWIAEHITYRVKNNYRNIQTSNHLNRTVVFADSSKWLSGNDFVAENVLQNRSAVCDGYARLFKSLCDYAGVRCALVNGYAKGDYIRQAKFRCNHTWNAVYIDGTWRLLDVTWASGYTNYSGDEFIKRYDDTYFLSSPEDFIRDHFPDDIRWALMEKPTLPHEFNAGPYKNRSFNKYKITSYLPQTGIIEASAGDTIDVTLETSDAQADSRMAMDTLAAFDSSMQKIISSVAFLEPLTTENNKQKLHCTFVVEDNNIEWLHIIYNHDAILRYRLKIKKEKNNLVSK